MVNIRLEWSLVKVVRISVAASVSSILTRVSPTYPYATEEWGRRGQLALRGDTSRHSPSRGLEDSPKPLHLSVQITLTSKRRRVHVLASFSFLSQLFIVKKRTCYYNFFNWSLLAFSAPNPLPMVFGTTSDNRNAKKLVMKVFFN